MGRRTGLGTCRRCLGELCLTGVDQLFDMCYENGATDCMGCGGLPRDRCARCEGKGGSREELASGQCEWALSGIHSMWRWSG